MEPGEQILPIRKLIGANRPAKSLSVRSHEFLFIGVHNMNDLLRIFQLEKVHYPKGNTD